jgi:hypothetical protein
MHAAMLMIGMACMSAHHPPIINSSTPCWPVVLQLSNVIGKRYGVHPTTSTERYKGQSHLRLTDADPESRKPWKTTNGVSS